MDRIRLAPAAVVVTFVFGAGIAIPTAAVAAAPDPTVVTQNDGLAAPLTIAVDDLYWDVASPAPPVRS